MSSRPLCRNHFERFRAEKTLTAIGTLLDFNASGDKRLAAMLTFDMPLDATNSPRAAAGTGFDYQFGHVDRLLDTGR
jgi:hypothetical protein